MPAKLQLLTHEFLPFTGGIGVYVEETARAATTAGIQTTIWAPAYPGQCEDDFEFAVNRIRMRGKQDWLCRWRLATALRKGFPDGHIPGTVILAEPGPIRLWMYRQLMRLPKPDQLVVILHGSEVRGLSERSRHRRRLEQVLQKADVIGVVSGTVREMVKNFYPEVEDKLVKVPGAVRSKWQSLPPGSRQESGPTREILQVGRIHPRKGQLRLVEAVSLLPVEVRKHIVVRLIGPVGKSAYANRIKELSNSLNLPVVLEGSLTEENLRRAYETATMLVMPSQPHRTSVEGLGLALLEAQHFGCPVIGTRIGGIPEAIREGESGLLVAPEDPHALAQALERLLGNPDLAASFGEAGSRFVREAFSWGNNVHALGLVKLNELSI